MINCAYYDTRLPLSLFWFYLLPFYYLSGMKEKGWLGENEGKGWSVGGANLFYLFIESESEKPTRTHH